MTYKNYQIAIASNTFTYGTKEFEIAQENVDFIAEQVIRSGDNRPAYDYIDSLYSLLELSNGEVTEDVAKVADFLRKNGFDKDVDEALA